MHYNHEGEQGFFHTFRTTHTRLFNNIIITIKNEEEARGKWMGISFNSSPPGQNGRHSGICIFLNENDRILIQISLKFVPMCLFDNKPALVQVMACRRTGNKPLPETMLTQFIDIYTALGGDELTQFDQCDVT